MEPSEQDFNKTLWFVAGYFAALAAMYFANWLIGYLVTRESQGVFVSPNGTAESERDEKVARESVELVKEYTKDE